FGMTWPLAAHAEVVGCGDDATAKVVLPEPIYQHPSRERIGFICEPVGQRGATTVDLLLRRGIARRQDDRKARLDFFARMIKLATNQQRRLHWRRPSPQSHGCRQRSWL